MLNMNYKDENFITNSIKYIIKYNNSSICSSNLFC